MIQAASTRASASPEARDDGWTVAADRGPGADVDEPVMNDFPEYADLRPPERERVTSRHIPNMTSGIG